MRHTANIRLRLVAFLLLMGGIIMWTSCSDDIGFDTDEGIDGEVTVRLSISAGDSGGISVSRADYTDTNALTGEYMNTLCVFVVDADDLIVAKLQESGLEGEIPIEEYSLTLATGSYTVYAFSNWDNTESTEWATLIAKTVGETISESDLTFYIDDPTSKVDIARGWFIPMSGSLEIEVSEEHTSFEVGMDRLVGRVEITIDGETSTDAQDVVVTSLSFGNYADRVSLMNGSNASSVNYDKTYSDFSMEKTITAGSTNNSLAVFYVNETSNATGFDISLTTKRGSEQSLYTVTTTTTDIPRNNILPIHLTLSTYTLALDVSAYAGPIGAEERQYSNVEIVNEDTYNVTLAVVTTWFTMTPSLVDSEGNIVRGVSWEWEQTSAKGQLTTDETTTSEALTSSGLTATDGYEYSFNLTATWTTSGVIHARTFHINIVLANYRPNYYNEKSLNSHD